jgi:hypothetical protein
MKKKSLLIAIFCLCSSTIIVVAQDNNFSIILFPDTQKEVRYNPDMWMSMPSWVVANKETCNVQAVIGLGDVTDTCTPSEFAEAVKGWNIIKDAGIIYIPLPGNHDLEDSGSSWDNYFGPNYFSGKPWFGGAYKNSTNVYYVKFDVGSHKYLVMALRYNPSISDLLWAQRIINANMEREVIVATHSFLNISTLTDQGTKIWRNLIRQNKNIFLVVCGHMHAGNSTSSCAFAAGSNGNKVYVIRVNYQDIDYGGGYMEILRFQNDKILASAYSAYSNETDVAGAYTITL